MWAWSLPQGAVMRCLDLFFLEGAFRCLIAAPSRLLADFSFLLLSSLSLCPCILVSLSLSLGEIAFFRTALGLFHMNASLLQSCQKQEVRSSLGVKWGERKEGQEIHSHPRSFPYLIFLLLLLGWFVCGQNFIVLLWTLSSECYDAVRFLRYVMDITLPSWPQIHTMIEAVSASPLITSEAVEFISNLVAFPKQKLLSLSSSPLNLSSSTSSFSSGVLPSSDYDYLTLQQQIVKKVCCFWHFLPQKTLYSVFASPALASAILKPKPPHHVFLSEFIPKSAHVRMRISFQSQSAWMVFD